VVIDDNNSENQDWDLTHTLARMHARGNDSITKEEALCEVRAEIQRRFVPNNLLENVITFIDEDKFDALKKEEIIAMEWADYIDGLVSGAGVVSIHVGKNR